MASEEGGTMHFFVTQEKAPLYLKHCSGPVKPADDPVAVFRRYTDHTTDYCSRVNLALAADSPSLADEGAYIRQLRDCVLKAPLLDLHAGQFYRGVDLSDKELAHMEALQDFYLPSFVSCSADPNLAYRKSARLIIKTHHTRNAATMTEELSPFCTAERETLFACYTAFHLDRVERVRSIPYLTLSVNDFFSELDCLTWKHNSLDPRATCT